MKFSAGRLAQILNEVLESSSDPLSIPLEDGGQPHCPKCQRHMDFGTSATGGLLLECWRCGIVMEDMISRNARMSAIRANSERTDTLAQLDESAHNNSVLADDETTQQTGDDAIEFSDEDGADIPMIVIDEDALGYPFNQKF